MDACGAGSTGLFIQSLTRWEEKSKLPALCEPTLCVADNQERRGTLENTLHRTTDSLGVNAGEAFIKNYELAFLHQGTSDE